jgi:Domain of Unknown Function (DUF1206)
MNPSMASSPGTRAGLRAQEMATSISSEADRSRSKPWFQRLTRMGLATRAAIYCLFAYFAADISLRHSTPAQASGSGALQEVRRQPAGPVMLAFVAVGLAGYALWRVAQALSRDTQRGRGRRADEETTALKRAGYLCGAGVYFFLCAQAVTLVFASSSAGSSGGASSHPQPFVATVLKWPAGPVWVGLVGAAIAFGAAALIIWSIFHDYSEVLETDRMPGGVFGAAVVTGVMGEAARGFLIGLVSVYLVSAAIDDNPSRAKSLDQALFSFSRLPVGPSVLLMAAAGLACFSAYSVIEALFRRI